MNKLTLALFLTLSLFSCSEKEVVKPLDIAKLEKVEITSRAIKAAVNIKIGFLKDVSDRTYLYETYVAPFLINGQTVSVKVGTNIENSISSNPNSFAYHIIDNATNEILDRGFFDVRKGLTTNQEFCNNCLFDAKAYFILK